jgi:hypothetical protein
MLNMGTESLFGRAHVRRFWKADYPTLKHIYSLRASLLGILRSLVVSNTVHHNLHIFL